MTGGDPVLEEALKQNAELVELLKRARKVIGYFEAAFGMTTDSEQVYWDITRWLNEEEK